MVGKRVHGEGLVVYLRFRTTLADFALRAYWI